MYPIKKLAAVPAALAIALSMTACQDNSVETEPAPAPTQEPGGSTQEPAGSGTQEPSGSGTQEPGGSGTQEPSGSGTQEPGGGEPGGSTQAPGSGGGSTVSEGEAAFGDTWAYDDGLSITVSKPDDTWKPSTSDREKGWDNFVALEVTITNNMGEKYDPSFMLFRMQSGGREGSRIFDSGNEVPATGGPSGSLLDGKSISYTIAFGVEDPKDLVLELTPDMDRDRDNLPTWVL